MLSCIYAAAVESLTQRFDPSTNKDMEIYEFRQITQESGETINEFYRRLKEKSSSCELTNAEAKIRTQIIHKTSDNRLRRKALREEMDLKALLTYVRTIRPPQQTTRRGSQNFATNKKIGHFGKYCMSKQRQPTGPSRQHNHQQQERHRYQNEEQKRHDRREVRGLSEQQPSNTDEEFIYTTIPSKKLLKQQSKLQKYQPK